MKLRSILVALLLLTTACSQPSAVQPAPVPTRIVSLVPSVTELLFALGAGPSVVGVTENDNFPPEVSELPRVGDLSVDYERLLALTPDLVVTDANFDQGHGERLKELGIPVLTLESASLAGLRDSLLRLGEVCGREARARELLAQLDRELDQVRRQASQLARRPSVFVEIWPEPLMTAGGGTFVSELVELAGGDNLFADVKEYPSVSDEQLVARDPAVIILTVSSPEEVASRSGWSGLQAVKSGRVYRVDSDLLVRPTLRVSQALSRLLDCFQDGTR